MLCVMYTGFFTVQYSSGARPIYIYIYIAFTFKQLKHFRCVSKLALDWF
jgi:hypothetical protein